MYFKCILYMSNSVVVLLVLVSRPHFEDHISVLDREDFGFILRPQLERYHKLHVHCPIFGVITVIGSKTSCCKFSQCIFLLLRGSHPSQPPFTCTPRKVNVGNQEEAVSLGGDIW